jgi:transcriptional regulator with XRE-family HTH domain
MKRNQMSVINFGQFIAIKREQLKFLQNEAARRVGVSPVTLAKWETGFIPSQKGLAKIAKAYSIQLEELEAFVPNKQSEKLKPRLTIKMLLTDISAIMCLIEDQMEAQSHFERNIKNLAINNLTKAEEILREIIIVDEAF